MSSTMDSMAPRRPLGDTTIEQLLLAQVGDQTFTLPLAAVERVVAMAAPTYVPCAPDGVIGMLNVQGTILPIVDPRPFFGVPTPPIQPGQQLILIHAHTRYLLWVDHVDGITGVPGDLRGGATWPVAVVIDDRTVPLLSPSTIDPGSAYAARS